MSVFVISDLHIDGSEDPLYSKLLQLMREKPQSGDSFVLAGDIFDLFVGKKKIYLNRYRDFLESVKELAARGVKVHYIEGNHDFLLRDVFAAIPGVQVQPTRVTIEDSGRKFLVAHGDLVDRQDYGYLALRMLFRSPLMWVFVKLVPDSWLEWIGNKSRYKSRRGKPQDDTRLPLDQRERLRCLYRSFAAEHLTQGFDFVILGHCHDLDEMGFKIDDRTGYYANVGFPRVHGSFVSWNSGDPTLSRQPLP